MQTKLFSSLQIRGLTLKNRIMMAPMCQYSAIDGIANNWHLVHLGARAAGGVGLIIAEATGVVSEGRISNGCLALTNQAQCDALKPMTAFIKSQQSIPAIQLAHSGRKGQGDWEPYAPSPLAFSEQYKRPRELQGREIYKLVEAFAHSATLALEAGFEVIEAHMAHGYLMHQFLSPLTNERSDEFGGCLENRMKFPLLVAQALRDVWPKNLPVFVRISATDWMEGGWDLEQSLVLCQALKKIGIDFIDVSSGGTVPNALVPAAPNFQVPFAKEIKQKVGILTGAVGLITKAGQAEEILKNQEADAILLGRELLREPYWPIKAAQELKERVPFPKQYERAY
ncbi:MAG: oxidoreductase [Bdellovibrionales bacterium GWA2_49_15]|nr:MAG: oxidoreductase [Bdellovibrionales bacterium GWA2_49_15]HAZ11331.1 oxidoreductase [Bdellovibrionales bacterium]